MEGYLSKKSSRGMAGYRGWRKRYFRLEENVLSYWKNENRKMKGKRPKVIPLVRFSILEPAEDKKRWRFRLVATAYDTNQRLDLRAYDKEQFKKWCLAGDTLSLLRPDLVHKSASKVPMLQLSSNSPPLSPPLSPPSHAFSTIPPHSPSSHMLTVPPYNALGVPSFSLPSTPPNSSVQLSCSLVPSSSLVPPSSLPSSSSSCIDNECAFREPDPIVYPSFASSSYVSSRHLSLHSNRLSVNVLPSVLKEKPIIIISPPEEILISDISTS